jgi:hypothetical protein
MPTRRPFLRQLAALAALAGPAALAGCAALTGAEPPRVALVGLEPLAGEGLELRFAARLRVQNPGGQALRYEGISLEMDLRGQRFASGVAPLSGQVPGWGETVLVVPVSVSAFSLARQLLDISRSADRPARERIAYALRGRLGGGFPGAGHFSTKGEIDLGELLR